jgi:hypothetical protein
MLNLFFIIAGIILITWAIAFFGFALGGLIHLLFIFAGVAILIGIVRGKRLKITIENNK